MLLVLGVRWGRPTRKSERFCNFRGWARFIYGRFCVWLMRQRTSLLLNVSVHSNYLRSFKSCEVSALYCVVLLFLFLQLFTVRNVRLSPFPQSARCTNRCNVRTAWQTIRRRVQFPSKMRVCAETMNMTSQMLSVRVQMTFLR